MHHVLYFFFIRLVYVCTHHQLTNKTTQNTTLKVNFNEPTRSRLQGPTRLATEGAGLLAFPTGATESEYVPVQGSATKLDSLYSALQWRLTVAWVKGQPLLVGSTQTVQANDVSSPLAVYWFVIHGAKPSGKDAAVTWSMGQDGLINSGDGSASPDTLYRWAPAAWVGKDGSVCVAYSTSSANAKIGARYSCRAHCDPRGTMRAEKTLYTAGLNYNPTTSRWGDYGTLVGIKASAFFFTKRVVLASFPFLLLLLLIV
jgi:hypothetical protein